jgi:hypothetical protein
MPLRRMLAVGITFDVIKGRAGGLKKGMLHWRNGGKNVDWHAEGNVMGNFIFWYKMQFFGTILDEGASMYLI